MGIWMEIRCENRNEPSANMVPPNFSSHCWSRDNSGPMDEALDTQAGVISTLKLLEAEAKKAGWKKIQKGWICPYCAKAMGLS